jgi:aconitate hydratase
MNSKKSILKSELEYFDINISNQVKSLPISLKILLENLIRNNAESSDINALINYKKNIAKHTIEYRPSRILMQDFTGVPAVVDLAALRDAASELGCSPERVNPHIPVDLVIDHSVQVDKFGKPGVQDFNESKEFERNVERYRLLKLGTKLFKKFRVVPPGTGICHQVNLEYLASVVTKDCTQNNKILYPDTLVGTDSHTTMINALCVLAWGVGGIEAEALMLGEPISMLIPEVLGVEFVGKLKPGVTATDLVLAITNILRIRNVVGKFVEFYGQGLESLTISDRATIANMAPECGSTCNLFPIDQKTLDYLDLTGKDREHVEIVELYAKQQGFWNLNKCPDYTQKLQVDLSDIKPLLAGPKRPQDKVLLCGVAQNFCSTYNLPQRVEKDKLQNGAIVIAAITSCTNTSNPRVMVGAGILARNAAALGLNVKPWVKTSLAPGSQVVSGYLQKSGLQKYLDQLGFSIVGFGCTTCIGNSGPLNEDIAREIAEKKLVVASILSGNRNFEGRIHQQVRANYLASPILVVAYAIAGFIDIDIEKDPIGKDKYGNDVFLNDIWPSEDEITQIVSKFVTRDVFISKYKDVFEGNKKWNQIESTENKTYSWQKDSTYIKKPPFFDDVKNNLKPKKEIDINNARIIAIFGDSVTTDHISPAGAIAKGSPAAKYLESLGVAPWDFNSYGARRGNHEVMMRGTFANIRIKNKMLSGKEGGYTIYIPLQKEMPIYDAAMLYKKDKTPVVVFAGKEYGTGSSRDWAAKGTSLLGIKAVIAQSFERIHRSNLIGMGVLPLLFKDGQDYQSLNLTGQELISMNIPVDIGAMSNIECIIKKDNKERKIFLKCAINTKKEAEYIRFGGVLRYVLAHSYAQTFSGA